MKKYLATTMFVVLAIAGCWKESPIPENPYDSIVCPTEPQPVDTLSKTSLVSLHKRIFSPSCAKANCHDGHFEPDFRTPESTFSTLVYHRIIKNDSAGNFAYRVIPYDTLHSVLHERLTNCCFVNINDRMPQDQIGTPLPDSLLRDINAWILAGAPDMLGSIAVFPNTEPIINYYIATNASYTAVLSNNRIDSVYYNPFIIANNTDMRIAIPVTDDSTAVANLVGKLRISWDMDDFSSSAPGYAEYSTFYVNGGNQGEFLVASINTGTLPTGIPIYMRFFVNDGDHAQDTYFPRNESITPYKTYWAFYVQP
ncbi:MAG: hypothetical protein SFW35_12830 [Chitinophagales bacterium]|nr:hypothetical protein [Chitinophagales bacterium]